MADVPHVPIHMDSCPVDFGSSRFHGLPGDATAAGDPAELGDVVRDLVAHDHGSTPMTKVEAGDRIWFADRNDKRPYTVKAVSADGRWAVCTKPFAARRTVIYTVVDFVDKLRGRDNYHGLGYGTDEECRNALAMFVSGEAEHSHRYPPIELYIKRIEKPILSHPGP